MNSIWWFYIFRCSDEKFYYGSTGNLRRRLINNHMGRVRSTKGRRPIKLVYFEIYKTVSKARKREMEFKRKKLHKAEVEKLIRKFGGFELTAPELPHVKLRMSMFPQ